MPDASLVHNLAQPIYLLLAAVCSITSIIVALKLGLKWVRRDLNGIGQRQRADAAELRRALHATQMFSVALEDDAEKRLEMARAFCE